MKRVVFLDRDGILLDHGDPKHGHGGMIVPGAKPALDAMKDAGFALICVTNQPDINAGKVSRDIVERVHHALRRTLPLDDIVVCPHIPSDNCNCRKPKPGMLLSVKDADFARSYMVGDRSADIGAGSAAGVKTILVGTGYGELFPKAPDFRAADLSVAAQIILEST